MPDDTRQDEEHQVTVRKAPAVGPTEIGPEVLRKHSGPDRRGPRPADELDLTKRHPPTEKIL